MKILGCYKSNWDEDVRVEVLTAVKTSMFVFWEVTPYEL
jgi:hypothetical protein